MINYDLSEDTIREFLETLIGETKTQNITWINDRSSTGQFSSYADLEENKKIKVYPKHNQFTLYIPDVSPQTYELKEEETKFIFAELCKLTSKSDQFKTNKFILDFIRIKNPIPQKNKKI